MSENRRVIPAARKLIAICLLPMALAATVAGLAQNVPGAPQPPGIVSETRVDINSASLDELMKIPGMTRTWALRIIRFRPYRAKNEILDRGVVTSEVYLCIKEFIVAHRTK